MARSPRRLGTFRRNSVRKCLSSRLYTVRNYGTARSQYYPKCHPASGARRRTISRIAVANSPHLGFGRRTHGPQRLLGIFYRFERPQTQEADSFWASAISALRHFTLCGMRREPKGVLLLALVGVWSYAFLVVAI